MASSDAVEITATLTHCSITDPAKATDGKYYLNAQSKSITLKADENCTFETAGSFVYQGSYNEETEAIKASHTDTVVYTLPEFDLNDQYTPFTLTMSATKKSTPTTTTPTTPTTTTPTTTTPTTTTTTTPKTTTTTATQTTTPTTTTTTTPKTTTPATSKTPATTATTPTTQLDVLKNSLRIPLDLKDDDKLLQSYIDAATEYLASTLDEESTGTRLNSKRARVVINALAELMYQNRGDDTVTKDFPFTLRALINQLKY